LLKINNKLTVNFVKN